MKEMTQTEIKKLALDALIFLRDVCAQHGLRYFLAYGTLLGAVRHQGYIPWDDDIDVWMPREDYEKLIEIGKTMRDDDWEIVTSHTESGYYIPWMKVCSKKTLTLPSRFFSGFVYGISIDILPLDGLKASTREAAQAEVLRLQREYIASITRVKPYATLGRGAVNRARHWLRKAYFSCIGSRVFSARAIQETMEKQLIAHIEDASFLACPVVRRYHNVWQREDFLDAAGRDNVLRFEGLDFPVPARWHEILTSIYGDYMTPPAKSQQVTHHTFTAYWKD